MKWLNEDLSVAIDKAIYADDADASALEHWSLRLSSELATGSAGRTSDARRALEHLQSVALKIVRLAAGSTGGELAALGEWMMARDAAESMKPVSSATKASVLDALYDLAAVIESAENDTDHPYNGNLVVALEGAPEQIASYSVWCLGPDCDAEEASYAATEIYELRDRLEWALLCLDFFKLEFRGRLKDFNINAYRRKLIEPDQRFRAVVAKAKREGWHQPDPAAPKSFWWRAK